jgi:LAO/AO transport system kinase
VNVSLASDPETLLAEAKAGSRPALARLLSFVERGGERASDIARATASEPVPYTVGITGAPGAGKSSLVDQLILRAQAAPSPGDGAPGGHVGVLAVDPTSPFSGGAILGDRVRMQRHATDPLVFIRSFATRGNLGGLSLAVPDSLRVLGAAGIGLVVIETVGVGQVEVDIARAADTTVVVVTPGWGDGVQAAKAGILEIADVFVVNKGDRPGASEARRDLEQMLELSTLGSWRPPIVITVAADGSGVDELWAEIVRHRAHLVATGELAERRAARARAELARVLDAAITERVAKLGTDEHFDELVAAVAAGRMDPYSAASELLARAGIV